MRCPYCNTWTETKDTRVTTDGVRRRRQCGNGHRFTTDEVARADPAAGPLMRHDTNSRPQPQEPAP